MVNFPKLSDAFRISRLEQTITNRPVRAVLDTDTYNEVDDQFALVWAMLSPEALKLEAVYAAPFHNIRSTGPEDGMEKSYQEIQRILEKMGKNDIDDFVFKGSRQWMPGPEQPVDSPAAQDLITRAMAGDEAEPLYVLSIAAPTNVASALLMEPELVKRIVVIWLGGQPLDWPLASEFNLQQDINASRILYNSGVPLVQIPCYNVAEHLRVTLPELYAFIGGKNALADYLCSIVHGFKNNPFGWSKVIWDISTVAWLINSTWLETTLDQTPILTDSYTYSKDINRHLFRIAYHLNRDAIFRDLYTKLNAWK